MLSSIALDLNVPIPHVVRIVKKRGKCDPGGIELGSRLVRLQFVVKGFHCNQFEKALWLVPVNFPVNSSPER